MGTYRLVLSILVLLSHVGILRGHDSGVAALVSFFLLSGFVMTALIRRNYNSPDRVATFYLDRAMRLFPQFLLYLSLTLLLVVVAQPTSPFLTDLSGVKVLLNALMLPLNFYMLGLDNALLIPQAWSLGLELTFYLVIPFLLLYRMEMVAFVGSIAVFMLAYFSVINNDIFGYRLLPGTLFIFLCGSFLYRLQSKQRIAILIATYAVAIALFLLVRTTPSLQVAYNYEVLIGLLIGLPVVALLSRMKFGKFDELLGNISYGVFLNHFLILWSLQAAGVDTGKTSNVLTLIACSLALAWVSYRIVERPVIQYRRKIRAKETFQNAMPSII